MQSLEVQRPLKVRAKAFTLLWIILTLVPLCAQAAVPVHALGRAHTTYLHRCNALHHERVCRSPMRAARHLPGAFDGDDGLKDQCTQASLCVPLFSAAIAFSPLVSTVIPVRHPQTPSAPLRI